MYSNFRLDNSGYKITISMFYSDFFALIRYKYIAKQNIIFLFHKINLILHFVNGEYLECNGFYLFVFPVTKNIILICFFVE
ncbi:hypothetical protein Z042_23865 [Chania multitudinisentens RB-25]|uniref:Uncharacterized protein n=1 Tax=Chania multitudinisentens RB-25 TaxID=1441930 RepID=W0LLT7_9GAMM|nr:hypothetical protein Z042_23865 [Chania multitudinisentens RB-25]